MNARLAKAAKIAIGVAIVAASGVLAHLHVKAQEYYPVIQLSSPEGLTFTAVHDVTDDRRECGETNDRFIAPVRARCEECEVVYARCDRELSGLDAALMGERPLPLHVVHSPNLRLAIGGPAAVARRICEFIAADLAKRGYDSAICRPPKAATKAEQKTAP